MYLLEDGISKDFRVGNPIIKEHRVRLLGSGTILREARKAAELLRTEYSVAVDVWSVTSFNELRREALEIGRENMLNSDKKPKVPFVTDKLSKQAGPVISATDYMKIHSDQVREFIPDTYRVLGTDGFGRSDTRKELRKFFEVDKKHIVTYTLSALAKEQLLATEHAEKAIKKYDIDQKKVFPTKL